MTFGQWMLVGLPISGISLVVAWLCMINFGAKITHIKSIIEEKDIIRKKLSDLGNLNRDVDNSCRNFCCYCNSRDHSWFIMEKYVLPMIDDSTIVIVAAISLFLIHL